MRRYRLCAQNRHTSYDHTGPSPRRSDPRGSQLLRRATVPECRRGRLTRGPSRRRPSRREGSLRDAGDHNRGPLGRPLLRRWLRRLGDPASIGKASSRTRLRLSERSRDALNSRPAGIKSAVLDPRDVGLRDTTTFGELCLCPAEFDSSFSDGVARMGEFGERGPSGHANSLCGSTHTYNHVDVTK